MITMKDLGRIRRLFYRDGVSLSEISRKTGIVSPDVV
jgi:DNA-binding transcriptional regulator LsrR (DeoR family)